MDRNPDHPNALLLSAVHVDAREMSQELCEIMNKQEQHYHDLMTQAELIAYLRIRELSKSESPDNVIDNLRRMRGLPVLHLCRQPMYWRPAIDQWIEDQITREK